MKNLAMAAQLAALACSVAPAPLTRNDPPGTDPMERRQPMVGGRGTRFAGFNVSSYDAEARTVEAVLSAGTAVRRYYFTEELEISEAAIDLGRVALGQVRLLDTHGQYTIDDVLGTVSNVRVEGGQLVGLLHFADTERGREIEGRVARGELTGISIGYRVTKWQITATDENEHETWRAVAWELLEVSLVPVPADPNAGVRSAPGIIPPGNTQEEDDMRRNLPGGAAAAAPSPSPAPAAEPAAPASRAAEPAAPPAPPSAPTVTRFTASDAILFTDQARSFGVEDRARELIQQNERGEIGTEAARSAIMQAAAERQRAETAPARGGPSATVSSGNEEATRGAIVTALVSRATGRALGDAEQGSREYLGMSILDLARARANVSARERDPDVILRAAHTTSDFPLIMEQAGQRILLERYQAAAPTFTRIARRRNLRDFRPTNLLRVGDFPTLKKYLEDGEIKAGTIGEGKESVQLASFGRRLILTRQAIVNDDLGAFDEVFGSIGVMIAQFENAYFYDVKNSNNGLGPKLSDNKTLFHADHGNLAGAGASMTVPLIGAGRAAMRKQKNIEGQFMNLAPRVLLVGPDTEMLAEQLTSPLVPQQIGNVNPFSGKLDIVAEGAIADYSYELYAEPAVAPVWVYGSLESAPGPRLLTKESFSVDGMQYRVTYDFYADAIDYRGAYRNPGAAPA